MKPLYSVVALAALGSLAWGCGEQAPEASTVCNPMNLSYQFGLWDEPRREAADPTMVLYHGRYYLFASKSGGYFTSDDMVSWELVVPDVLPVEDYAPTVTEMRDTLFFMASSPDFPPRIYKSAEPETGRWTVANDSFPIAMIDPDLFVDTDGRLYFYYGCSDIDSLHVVELDTLTLNPICEPVGLLNSDTSRHGWERFGDSNELPDRPWIEGPWVNKHSGRYYLQYACPGTQYKSYCDGLYVSDSPTGPFEPAPNNPFAYKPGGYICGGGHGSTFRDSYGNWWHVGSMTIGVKHWFERRLGLFPVFVDDDGEMYAWTAFGDYPMEIPARRLSGPDDCAPKWMLLSYGKAATASSELPGHESARAVDEEVRTYWSAADGSQGQWLAIDLDSVQTVHAVQLNFAEHNISLRGRHPELCHRYVLEHSADGREWQVLADKSDNAADAPHDYIELDAPVKTRYLRITNHSVPDGTFALSGFRVFGLGGGALPARNSEVAIERDASDPCVATLRWQPCRGATGYNICYGTAPDKLYLNYQTYGSDSLTIGSLHGERPYFFRVDAFNENGIARGAVVKQADAPTPI